MPNETESYASVHRKAVTESLRLELARAIAAIYDATHVAVYCGKVYSYGTLRACEDFARDCRGVSVRPMTDEDKHAEATHKRKAYRWV